MHEAFLHFIWSLQYFNRTSLTTTDGELIEVLSPGTLNVHSGADFSNAKIRIGGMAWAGSVEIHTKASFWYDHRHDQDPAYEQVILHVVWEQDKEVYRSDKSLLPALELKNRVDKKLILDYKKLLNNPFAIPCKKSFYRVDDLIKLNMVERALVQRLESKADIIIRMLAQNNGDWQETVYQVLARNFGFKVNSDPFFALAKSLPFKILLKHANHPAQIEALLFGQAGLLDVSVGDEYYKLLQREYRILTAKYSLVAGKLKRTQWRFLRLRPANFPTVRLAQFAALVAHRENIFSEILVPQNFHELKGLIFQSEYWRSHYRFNVATKKRVADFGDSSVRTS